jgi:hypothetical protein
MHHFNFFQKIILYLFQQVIKGQNQIINMQSYDHIKKFLNFFKTNMMVNKVTFKSLRNMH